MELDETDVTRDSVRTWRNCDAVDNRPPVMIIETFIDTEGLTNKQSLVIVDEHGRRKDVEEALNESPSSIGGNGQTRSEVILERWQMQLGKPSAEIDKDLALLLPRIYKNSIVLFRSLITYAKLLPAWRFGKKLSKPRISHNSPKLKYRVLDGSQIDMSTKVDTLPIPLNDARGPVVEGFSFDSIESPAGPFSIRVTYRSNCDFRIDDSEALLSSQFMGMDEQFFEPSLVRKDVGPQKGRHPTAQGIEAGSLPQKRRDIANPPAQGQAYGSLSTFHQVGPPAGSSPLSALRAVRDLTTPSPTDQPLQRPSVHRSSQGSRSSLRSTDGASSVGRRPSVSFMPFKTPSLSASPLQGEPSAASMARGSTGRSSALGSLAEARAPSHLAPQGFAPSRGSPSLPEQAIPSSSSSSPKPAPMSRYSSSFGHRKAKRSVGGGSRTDDDNNSSGKASITSSIAQPGSGVLAEGGGASSGSIPTDDDSISEFLRMLDQKKDLKSFRTSHDQDAADASTRRTTAALTKFQRMRDSNAALSDSMSSSLLLHRSSTSSSRQLSSVPPMIAGTSISTSSSPGKPISPHTPHTPAIPSRLSANSIIEYPINLPSSGNSRVPQGEETQREQRSRNMVSRDPNTGAIDIPTSPRPYHPSYRRSSSVAQQPRTLPIEDDLGDMFPFGMRSASLGADLSTDERPQLSLSALLRLQEGSAAAMLSSECQEPSYGPINNPEEGNSGAVSHHQPSSLEGREDTGSSSVRGAYRPRIGRGSGRGHTSPHGSMSSLVDRGSGSGSSDQRGGRYSFARPGSTFEEEEPLLFAMSDFGAVQQSRRSIEEARGGSSAGTSERGVSDSGASSRRGSRRGAHSDGAGRHW